MGGGIWPPSIFSTTIHDWGKPFGTLLALHETFHKMPTLPPGSRDKFAEVSTFWVDVFRIFIYFGSDHLRQIDHNYSPGRPFDTIFEYIVHDT